MATESPAMGLFQEGVRKPTVQPVESPHRNTRVHNRRKARREELGLQTTPFGYKFPFVMDPPDPDEPLFHPLYGRDRPLGRGWRIGREETPRDIARALQDTGNRLDILRDLENVPLPFRTRQELERLREQTNEEISDISKSVSQLREQERAIQEAFDTGTRMLEAMGLPSTIESVREDPEISAALQQVESAITTGGDLEAAINQLSSLSSESLQDIQRGFGREQWLAEMQTEIRNQVHNLVENRKALKDSLLEAEDWAQKEAEAQQLDLWDTFGDPSPEGRGFDVLTASVEPWFDREFRGELTDLQWTMIAEVMSEIWTTMPSDEVDEDGEPVLEGGLSPQAIQLLRELGMQLGLGEGKIALLIEYVPKAISAAQDAREQAASWKTSGQLIPGEAGLATGIYEVARDLYGEADPQMLQQMANSYYLHRLIEVRSRGSVGFKGAGNQFGLGALPEHTYRDMGYTREELEGNAELQLEALLTFIGMKYGPGYEGLQLALTDFVTSPEAWGDF